VDATAAIAHHARMRKAITDLTLRPRRPGDDAFLYRLSDRVFAAYSVDPASSLTAMLDEGDARAVIAEQGGAPVGFYILSLARLPRPFGPWQRPAVARLDAIGVLPTLHGRGAGGLLLGHAEDLARDEDAVSLTLMTADTNTRARRLFSGAGYQLLYAMDGAYAQGQRGLVLTKAL
jgi:GNAT superfamily N-acetyltransferase